MNAAEIFTLPEAWEHDALCVQTDPHLFFPQKGKGARDAKRICARCPVVDECLDRAMAFGVEVEGIWGGTTQRDRRAMKRAEREAAA
ncbi:WhiB family transcription factor [Mycobacterium phage Marshawn]|uniref:WhiB family transcription factor n=1 Tax=Mycobacterium phage Marshawn TaxID=2652423 RepID=A0A5P8D912_9CAUD|nr:WhiB transcriptional factor [Mycobacterium phage Marshawn]QFP94839.1 WhiB family transcription factor [Mycobacterium phage Marshawn]